MISVIIPMYNAGGSIIRALDSVRNQTYRGDVEIIVVNDGSTDSSLAIVNDYTTRNSGLNIKVIDKPNGGVSAARNAGMREATGKYIALLDSDDEWLSNKLERQIEILTAHPDIDLLGATRNGEYFKKILWKEFKLLTKISPRFLLIKLMFVVPTVIFKREILNDVGFFEERQKYAEDGNYFIRIASKYNCYLLNECLAITGSGKYHFGMSGLSGNLKEMERGELKNIKNAYKLKIINLVEYYIIVVFSLLKYLRRLFIVKYMLSV